MCHLKDNFFTRVLLCFLFLTAARISAQTTTVYPDDSTFFEGTNLYAQGKYEQALEKFQWLTREGASFRIEESKIFIAKIHVQSEQYSVAEIELKELLKKNTSSPYRDEMRFTLSDALWRQKKGFEALTVLMNGALLIKTDSLKQVNSTYITGLLQKLSPKELQDANNAYKGKSEDVILTYCFAKLSAAKGEREKAKQLLYPVVANVSLNPYRDACVKLYQSLESEDIKFVNNYVIGVMLPLKLNDTLAGTTPAKEVLDGIKYAVDTYNAKGIKTAGLYICDTKRDPSVIDSIVTEFTKVVNLKAVIGPLYSDECKKAAKAIDQLKLPIFSPTATDENLTGMTPYFWQANPTFSVRGKTLAHYIFEQEKKRKMAVIFSEDGNSSVYAKAFAREFVALHGSVVYEDKYDLNNPDLTRITNKLKAQQKNIDGIFVPVSNQKIINDLLSAFEQAELFVPIYGNQDWFNSPQLATSTALSSLLLISSDYFIDYSDVDFEALNNRFHELNGYDINRNVLYGFDVANLVMQSLEVQSVIPLDGGMMKSLVFKGLHNDFSFKGGKINSSVNLIRFEDGIYKRVMKYNPDSDGY
jgi:ABC-type branched-subunit amino acid transport system substrate-binding protein